MNRESSASGPMRPPLPPRQNVSPMASFSPDKAWGLKDSKMLEHEDELSDVTRHDCRILSQQATQPSIDQQNRRKLLLVFIHGFMGNETSFQGFPAHVHNILTVLLAESHVVHTKIYPRYRSRKNISFARDDFSRWLEPHEDESTDIVLLGHSMGGLLAADVALISNNNNNNNPARRSLKHDLLGTINFDVPFLGLHPGVVKSGLASIFRPAEEDHEKDESTAQQSDDTANNDVGSSGGTPVTSPPQRADTFWSPKASDPNFNPSFTNDVILPVRKGWRNALHFINKHINDLPTAAKQVVSSHLEFGGAMANYSELKIRYSKIRALEQDDPKSRKISLGVEGVPSRVRFVNYYTVCTGRPKKPSSPRQTPQSQGSLDPGASTSQLDLSETASIAESNSPAEVPSDETTGVAREKKRLEQAMKTLIMKDDTPPSAEESTNDSKAPPMIEVSPAPDDSESTTNGAEGSERGTITEPESSKTSIAGSEEGSTSKQRRSSSEKPPKDRTFCVLPPTDSLGQRDPTWVRVSMGDVDEVGAHCGLFFVGERYERLVGDVASRIEIWAQEAQDVRISALYEA